MADPGFPVGGREPRKGGVDSRGGYVSKILYVQNERMWTLVGGGLRRASANVDPPIEKVTHTSSRPDLIGKFVIGIDTHHQAINLHRCTTS